MGTYGAYVLETFLTLLAVCGLAFVVLYGARRLGIGRPSGPIRLVGQLPLDARRFIYLVRVGSQVIVVGVGEGGFTKLGELAASELPKDDPPEPVQFARILEKVMGRRDAAPRGDAPSRDEAKPTKARDDDA